ncbi:MAG: threonylcarbamoyl-AMP synthase [Verrucomicrobia bacterium]|jgi:L-threonylcarbamoyladenylate synthase|nr:threonylcarbamoyl-AMP synthase [Verrucomicrobiota bacterium]
MRRSLTTEILPTHTAALFHAAVQRVAAALRAGEVVAVPTETVYGLAANALDASAVARIYAIKGRPAHNPIIVHVADKTMARRCVREWPAAAEKLARAFWPGPLTLVLPKADDIPDIVTAGGPTVGVRWPAHPFVPAVIRECGFPLAAPSANRSNQLSPTTAEHVRKQLGGRLRWLVDGGPAPVGIESTVLDLTTHPPQILRPGMIHAEALAAVIGERPRPPGPACEPPDQLRSPGMLRKHYAPRARVIVLTWHDTAALQEQLTAQGRPLDAAWIVAHTRIPAAAGFAGVSVLPHDAAAYARALYAEWYRCDEAGAKTIVMEAPPDATAWSGVADRLRRAAA